MSNNHDEALLELYDVYSKSEEAVIVKLIKKPEADIDSNNKWIDVVDYDSWVHRSNRTGYNYLIVELFDRKMQPIYPKKDKLMSNEEYKNLCKAITWHTAHEDIRDQRTQNIQGQLYLMAITFYNRNRGKKQIIEKPFWNEEYGGFDHTGKVPTTTKRYEVDLEPAWDFRLIGPREINFGTLMNIKKYYNTHIYKRIIAEKHIDLNWFLVDYEPEKPSKPKPNGVKSNYSKQKHN
jgi:hypothetical protein